jgi:MFS family permease
MTSTTKGSGHDDSGSAHRGDSQDKAVIGHIKERLLTLDFIFATLANFANSFGQQMVNATLPVYVISIGGTQAEAGLVSGALTFTALFFRPYVGWLTDAWRRRPLVLIGTSCNGLASVVYLLAGSIPFLLFGRLVHGLGLSCYTTAANAYVADIAPSERRAEAMGLFSAAYAFALVIGPVIGFMLVGSTGFEYLFYCTAGLGFIAFVISLFARERRQPGEIKGQPWSPRTGIVAVDALPIAWTALCMGMGFGTVTTFISIFAQSRGVQNPGFYFMVQAIALLISRTFAGHLADKYGRTVVVIPSIILMAAALALLPMANGLPYFVISASLFGMGFGAGQPATMAILIDKVRPEQRGLATGTYYIGFDVGYSIGSILLGVVSQFWGFGMMWPLAAACTLFGLAGLLADHSHPPCVSPH